ncbi:MAG: MraY family glycosyltransferase [Planctomycetota bacterium]
MNTWTPDLSSLADPVAPADQGALVSLAPYMGVFFVAFFVAIVATFVMRKLAIANGIVDWPDLKRKNHALPVAYLGGIGIFIGWVAGVFVSYLLTPDFAPDSIAIYGIQSFPLSIFIGAGVITLTGLFDDVNGLSPRTKVGGQLFAAAALTWNQIGINLTEQLFGLVGLAPSPTVVYFAATMLVALFVLGGCNAVNLIDGLDGLASGVVAIAMIGFLTIAVLMSDVPEVAIDNPKRFILCLATIGAILGFLPYNFNPATIFMGDAGSLLLGFLSISAILLFGDALGWSLKLVTAALVIFAVPITDTSLAIVRRKLRGQPILSPDNQHLHHLLRKSGLSVKKSVFVMYGAALVFGALGVAMVALELQWRYSLAIFTVLYGFIMVLAFKYGAYCLEMDRQQREAVEPAIAEGAPIDQPAEVAGHSNGDTNGDSAVVDAPEASLGNGDRLGTGSRP